MSKTTAYFFTSNYVRSLTNPSNLEDLKLNPRVAIDPDLSSVAGLDRRYWKISDHKVLPMNALERAARDADHERNGVDHNVTTPKKIRHPMTAAARLALKPLLYVLAGALLAHLLGV